MSVARLASTEGPAFARRAFFVVQSAKINQSLLALGRVIQHLADKPGRSGRNHVPFRDSKLTRLLQPCLGGNSKMAIIGTVSPGASSLDNTKATLNFVSTAAKV
jgi:centromeric protein E